MGGSRARSTRDAALRGRAIGPGGAVELLGRRHDAGMGLSILERPRARGDRRKAERRWKGRAARDSEQDADVHGALHGRLAATKQPRADVAGDVQGKWL